MVADIEPESLANFTYDNPKKRKQHIKLHVRRFSITDDCIQCMLEWSDRVMGVSDSQDIPLTSSCNV